MVEIVQWTCDLTNNGNPNPHSYLIDNPDLCVFNPLVSFKQLPSQRANAIKDYLSYSHEHVRHPTLLALAVV